MTYPLDEIKDQFNESTATIKSFFERLGKASENLGEIFGKGFENEKQAAISLTTWGTMLGLFNGANREIAEALDAMNGQIYERNIKLDKANLLEQNEQSQANARMLWPK